MMKQQTKWVYRADGSYGPKRHWYFITTFYCPLCGSSKIYRERRYGRRPYNDKNRVKIIIDWDYCM